MYPGLTLGLSDHTPGHSCVLGAVALGARIIEKHFTDDVSRSGPDHKFSLDPTSWTEMVTRTRELEYALGNGIKRVEFNELETVVVQRRSLRVTTDLKNGHTLSRNDLVALRPCPDDALNPAEIDQVIGQVLRTDKKRGEYISIRDLE